MYVILTTNKLKTRMFAKLASSLINENSNIYYRSINVKSYAQQSFTYHRLLRASNG